MRAKKYRGVVAACLLAFLPGFVQAASTPWIQQEHSRIRLLAGAVNENSEGQAVLPLGIELELEDGWKTYWRSPGDAGQPFTLLPDTQASNIGELHLLFPQPTRFVEDWGLESFGYHGRVVFFAGAMLADKTKETQASFTANYAVCSNICVPYTVTLSLTLPPGGDTNAEDIKIIESSWPTIPGENGAEGAGLTIESPHLIMEGGKELLEVRVQSRVPFVNPDLFVEGPPLTRFPKADLTYNGDKTVATFHIPFEQTLKNKSLAGEMLTLTIVDGGNRSVEGKLKVEGESVPALAPESMPSPVSAPVSAPIVPDVPFAWALFAAFIGGLILNIMPCVLPVLSIKVLGVLKHGGKERFSVGVRQAFLASALGIEASFLVLAAGAVALKWAGAQVGWGLHFQSPQFLVALILIVILFASNLWGHFEVALPHWLGGRLLESGPKDSHSLAGHFFSGALATLLATPCTAPFVGTAVSFALAHGAHEILLIFAVMGLGLASPFLLIAAFPGMVRLLPNPGEWMVKAKHFMGWLLFATALWLLWVLAMQVGYVGAGIVLLLAVLMLIKLWRLGSHAFFGRKQVLLPLIAILAVLAFMVPLRFHHEEMQQSQTAALWQPFEETRIPSLVAEGKTVFVDVTAAWCLTCKANKTLVLDTEEITALLKQDNIVAMQADWTNPNPAITAFLNHYGRYGVPFNIVFSPVHPDGLVLPELLTKEKVKKALE